MYIHKHAYIHTYIYVYIYIYMLGRTLLHVALPVEHPRGDLELQRVADDRHDLVDLVGIYVCVYCVGLYVYMYTRISPLSLSLSIHTYVYIYIYTYT